VDSEAEAEAEVDSKDHIKEANKALTIDEDSSHAGRRNALFARRKDAGLPITQIKSARLPVRNLSLRYTLQVRSHLRTS